MNTNNAGQQPQGLIRLQQSSSSPKFLHLDIDSNERRQIPVSNNLNAELNDDSSPEEPSYRAEDYFDDFDEEPLPKGLNDNKSNGKFPDLSKNVCKSYLKSDNNCACIPEYTVGEENKNVRNFMCITLPDGKTRDIDMKVCIF